MKKRTVLMVALLLAAGLAAAWMIYSGNSGSAFCEHPVGPDLTTKPRSAKPDGLDAASNVVCEHPTSFRQTANKAPANLGTANQAGPSAPTGQQR
jgi:hypothetical protein